MTANTLCMLEIPTNLHTLTSHNFRYKILELQIHTPHETYNCQTLSLTRSLLIFIIPHHRLLHLIFNCIRLKDVRHSGNNLSFIKLQPSTPSGILPSSATRSCSLFKTLMHTTPTKIKESQITRNLISSSSAQNLKDDPLAEPPSFIYAQLLILLKSQAPIIVTFTRVFMKNKNQPR